MSLTYAIGDIHGCLDKLRSLLLRCEMHADGRPMSFVFVGDYIDRGPQSCAVIDCLIDLKAQHGEGVVTLMGNHEAMALAAIDGRSPTRLWFAQGGLATLKSYGVAEPSELPGAHVDWLRALPLSHDDGRRFFVHAGVNSGMPLEAQADHRPAVDQGTVPVASSRLRPPDRARPHARSPTACPTCAAIG